MRWIAVVSGILSLLGLIVIGAGAFAPVSRYSAEPSFQINIPRSAPPPKRLNALFPAEDAYGKRILRRPDLMVVYAGSCTTCTLRHINFQKLPYGKYSQIAVIFESPLKEIPERLRYVNAKLRIIADADGRLSDALQAQWGGRWYLVKGDLITDYARDPSDSRLDLGQHGNEDVQ